MAHPTYILLNINFFIKCETSNSHLTHQQWHRHYTHWKCVWHVSVCGTDSCTYNHFHFLKLLPTCQCRVSCPCLFQYFIDQIFKICIHKTKPIKENCKYQSKTPKLALIKQNPSTKQKMPIKDSNFTLLKQNPDRKKQMQQKTNGLKCKIE